MELFYGIEDPLELLTSFESHGRFDIDYLQPCLTDCECDIVRILMMDEVQHEISVYVLVQNHVRLKLYNLFYSFKYYVSLTNSMF